jgi:hypothetical protein
MTKSGQAGIPGERRARKIEGQFIARRLAMIESPAYQAASLSARRCLDRMEIEHLHHAGKENGKLPVTYEHFVEFGVSRRLIAKSIRELVALGFLEITRHGVAGNAEHRESNLFRLTYLHAERAKPTDEWRRIKTTEEAERIAKTARKSPGEKARKSRVRKQISGPLSAQFRDHFVGLEASQQALSPEHSPGPLCGPTSISREGSAAAKRRRGPTLRLVRGAAWNAPVVVEITDPAEVAAIRQADARSLASPKCPRCQADPIVIRDGSRMVATRNLAAYG